MSVRLSAYVWSEFAGTAVQKLVLLAIADRSNDEGLCWPSINTIAADCGIHRITVIKTVTALCGTGWLSIPSHGGWLGSRNRSNTYRLTVPESAVKGYAHKEAERYESQKRNDQVAKEAEEAAGVVAHDNHPPIGGAVKVVAQSNHGGCGEQLRGLPGATTVVADGNPNHLGTGKVSKSEPEPPPAYGGTPLGGDDGEASDGYADAGAVVAPPALGTPEGPPGLASVAQRAGPPQPTDADLREAWEEFSKRLKTPQAWSDVKRAVARAGGTADRRDQDGWIGVIARSWHRWDPPTIPDAADTLRRVLRRQATLAAARGHRPPRFPRDCEPAACAAVRNELLEEQRRAAG